VSDWNSSLAVANESAPVEAMDGCVASQGRIARSFPSLGGV
jgi:hypothetical protein